MRGNSFNSSKKKDDHFPVLPFSTFNFNIYFEPYNAGIGKVIAIGLNIGMGIRLKCFRVDSFLVLNTFQVTEFLANSMRHETIIFDEYICVYTFSLHQGEN